MINNYNNLVSYLVQTHTSGIVFLVSYIYLSSKETFITCSSVIQRISYHVILGCLYIFVKARKTVRYSVPLQRSRR